MKIHFLKSILILIGAFLFWSCAERGGRGEHGERHDSGGWGGGSREHSYDTHRNYDPGRSYGARQEYGVRWGYEVPRYSGHDGYNGHEGHEDNRSNITFGAPRSDGFDLRRHDDAKRGSEGFFDFINDWSALAPELDPDADNAMDDDVYNTCPNPCINYHRNLKEIERMNDQIKYLYGAMSDRNRDTLQDQIDALEYEVGDLSDEDKSLSRKAENCGCLR